VILYANVHKLWEVDGFFIQMLAVRVHYPKMYEDSLNLCSLVAHWGYY